MPFGGKLSAELSTLLGSVCWSESKASCNLDRAIRKQTTGCYLPNWRLSMASHVGTGLRQEDHPQASTQHLPGGL